MKEAYPLTGLSRPEFLYFDLGNVLLFFDHQQGCQQLAQLCGVTVEQVRALIFDSGMQWRYETGELTSDEFMAWFCSETGSQPGADAFALAVGEIFTLNRSMLPVITQLAAARHRLGILSNTCELHYRYFASGRYGFLPSIFEQVALSYELGRMKPDPQIYLDAAKMAGVAPEKIFYTDDIAGHINAAREAGFDAVQYTTTPALVSELRRRGLRFNY